MANLEIRAFVTIKREKTVYGLQLAKGFPLQSL